MREAWRASKKFCCCRIPEPNGRSDGDGQGSTGFGDLSGGLVKTLVFGAMIAGIGCLKGLQTGTGASAVGDSATKAVVSSIIAIVVVDGVFAVIYYYLGI